MAVPVFGFGLLVLVGLVGLVIGILALVVNDSTRGVGLTLGVMLLLGGGLLAALLFVGKRVAQTAVVIPVQTQPAISDLPAEKALEPAPPSAPLEAEKTPTPEDSPAEKKPRTSPSLTDPATETTLPPTSSATPVEATDEKPGWVDQPGHLQGTIYRTSVKSGLFVTRAECEQALEPKLKLAITQYVDDYLAPNASKRISLDADLLKRLRKSEYEEVVNSATVGPMRQLHALLEFDDAARARLAERWHETIVAERLGRTALVSGVALGLLAVAFGYLKLDILTAGQFRGRLRFAVIAAILLIAMAACLGCQPGAGPVNCRSPSVAVSLAPNDMPLSEAESLLISRIRTGDADAWTEMIARFEGRLLAFVEGRLGRRATGEDVVQETFIGFLNSLPNYDESRPLESYLFSIAAHKLTDHLRREGRRPVLPLTPAGTSDDWQPPARGRAVSSMLRSDERQKLETTALVEAMREQISRMRERGDWTKLKCLELLITRGWANKDVATKLSISEQQVANFKSDFVGRLKQLVQRQHLPPDVFPELHESG